MLDPDAELLRQAILAANPPPLESLSPAEARAAFAESRRRAGVTGPEMYELRDLDADGIRSRLYRPAPGVLPIVLFLHGGGWVLGDLDSHDALCRHVAQAAGAAVIAVDYRLAPEHPFPAAVEDAMAALRWVAVEASGLGLDGSRIAAMGDSAGGNLVAVLALMASDGTVPALALQVLAYPVTDVTLDQPSHALAAPGMTLTGAAMRWFRDHYLAGGEADWRAAPLRRDPRGTPPALLLTAGQDPLCDEGLAYAARLAAAGVRLEHRHYPGQMHGFLTAGLLLPTAQAEIIRIGQSLATAFDHEK